MPLYVHLDNRNGLARERLNVFSGVFHSDRYCRTMCRRFWAAEHCHTEVAQVPRSPFPRRRYGLIRRTHELRPVGTRLWRLKP